MKGDTYMYIRVLYIFVLCILYTYTDYTASSVLGLWCKLHYPCVTCRHVAAATHRSAPRQVEGWSSFLLLLLLYEAKHAGMAQVFLMRMACAMDKSATPGIPARGKRWTLVWPSNAAKHDGDRA